MDQTQQPVRAYMDNLAWWLKNQVVFTFHSELAPTQGNKQLIIDSLHLDDINRFLQEHNVTLKSFGEKNVAHPRKQQKKGKSHLVQGNRQQNDNDSALNSPIGKYLFPSPDEPGSTLIAFFNIQPAPDADDQRRKAPAESMQESYETDHTLEVVNLINTRLYIPGFSGEQIKLPAASPNWFGSGTQDVIHGWATPPMPVAADNPCIAYGHCHIYFQKLTEDMQSRRGEGVRVFVLDTMPSPEQIKQASDLANPADGFPKNRLLQDMATGMQSANAFNDQSSLNAEPPAINVYYQDLPGKVVCDPPGSGCDGPPRTGEDLYKQLIGFAAPDHGLFIAGIIRDLAPGAKIECVRVLNDYAVGDFSALTQALEAIHIRMSSGVLMNTPVVINLSLVMTPDTRTLDDLGFKTQDYVKTAKDLREPLHQALKSVINRGAVVVAAAGSDSNTLAMPGRHDPRYPAGFTEVVSVSSVTGSGEVTDYSNRAASAGRPHGIATYGGSIATPVPPPTSRTSAQVAPKRTNCMTGAKDIDALIGVYTSSTYPKLAGKRPANPNPPGKYDGDCQDTYEDTNPTLGPRSCWAYWSGTSFSTSIISALVARIIEGKSASNVPSSQQVIATINADAVVSENSELGNVGVVGVDHCQQGVVKKGW